MASLSLFNRPLQSVPQFFRRDVLQGEFQCHECGASLKDLGYWTNSSGRVVLWRCVNRHCNQCAVNHAPVDTTFASRNWI